MIVLVSTTEEGRELNELSIILLFLLCESCVTRLQCSRGQTIGVSGPLRFSSRRMLLAMSPGFNIILSVTLSYIRRPVPIILSGLVGFLPTMIVFVLSGFVPSSFLEPVLPRVLGLTSEWQPGMRGGPRTFPTGTGVPMGLVP